MSLLHPDHAPHPIHTVHRIGAGVLGGFLLVFGVVRLLRSTEFMSIAGTSVFGLTTNGLLATISVLVGLGLLAAAVRGGPSASTTLIGVGGAFLLSGLGNAVMLGAGMSSMNVLAFGLPNVVFSVVVGATLLFVGAYGRVSGGLRGDSPYADDATLTAGPTAIDGDGQIERAMAAAERAVALRTATPDQERRVRAAAAFRSHHDRRTAFRDAE